MKKILIAAVAVCAVFASCSKDENNNAVTGEKAKLTIGVTAPAGSRAAGTLEDESDNAVGEFKAYVFAGDQLQAIMTSTDGTAVTNNTDVTTAANAIYVIANANSATELSTVTEGTTSKTAFLELAGNLLNSDAFAAKSAAGNVWASGYETLAPTDFNPQNEAAVSVEVSPIPARINVTVNDQRDNKDDPEAYKITHVQVLNAAGTARFIALSAFVAPTTWYNGAVGNNLGATVSPYFKDDYSASGHMFYTFENDASAYPTIVTLVTDNGTNTRYYPVHFTTDDAEYVIERGNSYQVAIKLTGDAKDDTGITDPEVPVVTASLEVSVTAKRWTMVGIDKEF